jgi:hypothetical protein
MGILTWRYFGDRGQIVSFSLGGIFGGVLF